jgi:hypothetical protein
VCQQGTAVGGVDNKALLFNRRHEQDTGINNKIGMKRVINFQQKKWNEKGKIYRPGERERERQSGECI